MTQAMEQSSTRNRVGLWLGPVLALAILAIGAPAELATEGPVSPAWFTFAVLVWMAVWWVSEAVPIPVTSLLPLVLLPTAGVAPLREVSGAYMHPVVVLLMGGFIFAKAIERWNLHERIALNVVSHFGASPNALIAGFLCASALLSMWISNSATSIMMMPIAISLAYNLFPSDGHGEQSRRYAFTAAILLAIAYGCSIGGLGTPIGTPTNLIIIGYLEEIGGITIDFAQWMLIGIPTVVVMLPIALFVLTRWAFRLDGAGGSNGQSIVEERLSGLGKMTTPERRVLMTFAFIALLWVSGPLYRDWAIEIGGQSIAPLANLSDHIIAVLAVVLCFLVPAGVQRVGEEARARLLDWPTAESIPWGTLLLFGGGLSMAGAINSSGLGGFFGNALSGLGGLPALALIVLIVAIVLFLTEITSNVATASIVAPILGAVALNAGIPLETILIPIALAASCAFMLPMATGPNAVVFSSGHVTMGTMMRAGLGLNLCAIVAVSAIGYFLPALVL